MGVCHVGGRRFSGQVKSKIHVLINRIGAITAGTQDTAARGTRGRADVCRGLKSGRQRASYSGSGRTCAARWPDAHAAALDWLSAMPPMQTAQPARTRASWEPSISSCSL